MSNDIQKYRYLIENIILDESFKDAERIFTDVSSNQKEVSSYIDLFKELAKRNKIQGIDKDISRWIKSGWEAFKEFVDSKKEVQSKRETKAVQKKDSIRIYQDEEKIVVIPLTKEASIHYGRNTQWCTSATESTNHFPNYFYINGITLFYVLFKNGDKYACAFHPTNPDEIEYFDQLDNSMSFNKFSYATRVSISVIREWYSSNKGVILKAQDFNNLSEKEQFELIREHPEFIEHIKNPSEAAQLAAVQNHDRAIEYIDEPSEQVQLAAVQNDGYNIHYIIKKGITPSEQVQLAAVQNYDEGTAIQYIINNGITPSEAVQLAAVKEYYFNIQYIIKKGFTPSEAVQLAAVKESGYAIEYIDEPSEQVQLAAVQNDGYNIYRIIKNGITPSEQVQLAAVQNDGSAIQYIDKPSEKVKALYNKLYK